jgi:lysophospholipase L1-like esterase
MLEEPTMTPVKKYVSSTPILFKQILSKASDMVAKWEGMLYFVYLPTFDRYTTGSKDFLKIEHEFRNEIINFMKDNDVPIIDMHKEVFSKHPNVQSLFPFTLGGHYNDEGYRLVAEAIVKRINSDGFVSSHPTK